MVLSNTQATKHMNKESFELFDLRIADLHNKRLIAEARKKPPTKRQNYKSIEMEAKSQKIEL